MVVVEERGNPAGLRQAPWERRRRRGRAAPTRDQIVCYGQPLGLIYIGEGEGCAPFRVSHPQGVRPALDGTWGGGQEGERGEARLGWALGPICPRVCPLPHFPCALGPVGGAPAHLGLVPCHTWPMLPSKSIGALAKVAGKKSHYFLPHRLLSPLFRDLDLIPSGYDLIPSKGDLGAP